ncbi:hypothetical protein ACPPVO_21260 [Dactylosporangium sp. McL0621]|uniref:hypothetical protein n=1 Tax=Dactylosporangium sp. McL0621 TaxID=3415678 RepID=UPI003CE9A475
MGGKLGAGEPGGKLGIADPGGKLGIADPGGKLGIPDPDGKLGIVDPDGKLGRLEPGGKLDGTDGEVTGGADEGPPAPSIGSQAAASNSSGASTRTAARLGIGVSPCVDVLRTPLTTRRDGPAVDSCRVTDRSLDVDFLREEVFEGARRATGQRADPVTDNGE